MILGLGVASGSLKSREYSLKREKKRGENYVHNRR